MTLPTWLPPLLVHDGYWETGEEYLDRVYTVFENDFYRTRVLFRGTVVSARKQPTIKGKAYSFWHVISEGKEEEARLPDFRRYERIGWIRACIENSEQPDARVWISKRKTEDRLLLSFADFSYLVVIAKCEGRGESYYRLVTAFPVEEVHRRNKLKKEWEGGKL